MRWTATVFLLLGACAPEQTAETAGPHPTIVSLNPCTDAILAEVAGPEQLLAISHYSHDPAASSMPQDLAHQYPVTGGTVEEVLALDPDVVVAGSFLPPATRNAFERLGIRVETLGIASTIADSEAQVRQLAALAGQPHRGEALVARIDQAWAASTSDAPPIATLFWQEGGIVPGPDSLVAQLMAHTGLHSHSAARGLGQGAYLPLERVITDPPALIIAASDERMLAHPVLRRLPGTRYETFDPTLLYCAGPSIPPALERLAHIRRSFETPPRPAASSAPQDERLSLLSVRREEGAKTQAEHPSRRILPTSGSSGS